MSLLIYKTDYIFDKNSTNFLTEIPLWLIIPFSDLSICANVKSESIGKKIGS